MDDRHVTGDALRFETRLPCPVCLGVQMEKARFQGASGTLVLDHCRRCGGVWFDRGEVQGAGRLLPADLWRIIPPRKTAPKPPCHSCHAPLDRAASVCAVCGQKNELACPECDRTMERRTHAALTLDVCATCHGVWFDHTELRSLWSLALSDVASRRAGRDVSGAEVTGNILLDSLFWAPGFWVHGAEAAAHGAGEVAGALGSLSADGAASAAMGASEVVGGAAEGVFETIMEIIGSLFD